VLGQQAVQDIRQPVGLVVNDVGDLHLLDLRFSAEQAITERRECPCAGALHRRTLVEEVRPS
jgi:hypothetical protein